MVSKDKLREDCRGITAKTAGGYMKSKRLTIIFFSVMMLAATPRVMSHFNTYTDALHKKVEAEWLDFLLGFTVPAEFEKNEATPQNSQQPSVCTKGTKKDFEPATAWPGTETKASPNSNVSKKQSYEYTITNLPSASNDSSSELAPGVLSFDLKAPSPIVQTPSPPGDVVAGNGDERKKAEFLWRLTQSTLNGKSKGARSLVREFRALIAAKSRPVDPEPFNLEKVIDHLTESDKGNADQESHNDRTTSEESMR